MSGETRATSGGVMECVGVKWTILEKENRIIIGVKYRTSFIKARERKKDLIRGLIDLKRIHKIHLRPLSNHYIDSC